MLNEEKSVFKIIEEYCVPKWLFTEVHDLKAITWINKLENINSSYVTNEEKENIKASVLALKKLFVEIYLECQGKPKLEYNNGTLV